jgi:Spy/CpxP family protein refolding chaperone
MSLIASFPVRRLASSVAAMLLGAVMFGAVPALAQDGPPPGGSPPGGRGAYLRIEGEILKNLHPPLSPKQIDQIKAARAEMMKQNENVTDRATRMANGKAFRDKITSIMTPAQAADFKKQMDAARAKMRAEHPDGGPGGGPPPNQ